MLELELWWVHNRQERRMQDGNLGLTLVSLLVIDCQLYNNNSLQKHNTINESENEKRSYHQEQYIAADGRWYSTGMHTCCELCAVTSSLWRAVTTT
jgi:hypothetical protein